MRIFIEIEVRMMPFCATKKQRNGIVVHREKREGGSDIFTNQNYEISNEMRGRFGKECQIAITYILKEEDAIV